MQDLDQKSARLSQALLISVVLCFLMLLISTVVLVGLSRTAVRTDEWIGHTLEVKAAIEELRAIIRDVEADRRSYLTTGESRFLMPADAVRESTQAQLQVMRRLVADNPVQTQRLETLAPLLMQRLAAIEEAMKLAQQNDLARIAEIISTRGAPLLAQIRELLKDMDAHETDLLIERRREAKVIREQFVAAVGGMVIVAAIFAVFALLSVRTYLRGLEQGRRRIAAYQTELEARVAERTSELTRATELALHERKRAETLLTDVNHRVGNNLALVSSFLTMQQRAVASPEAAKALAGARARVQAVAAAHRKLRLGADFATVKANEVIGAVIDDISAGLMPHAQIQIQYDLLPLDIQARDAVSLGVLTSELVMNAVKHGFPNGESGHVNVIFGAETDGQPFLEVTDDGVGYESNNNDTDESKLAAGSGAGLGVRITEMLARQFGGEMRRSRLRDGANPGTCVRIELRQLELSHPG